MSTGFFQRLFQRYLESQSGSDQFIWVGSKLFSLPTASAPCQDIPTNTALHFQGFANSQVIPFNLNRIWPFWAYRQLDPQSKDYHYSGTPFSLLNVTHRNWSILTHPNTCEKAIIDPRGLITPLKSQWSLDFWVANASKVVSPSQLKKVSQQYLPDQSGIDTSFSTEHLHITSISQFGSDHNDALLLNTVSISNKSPKKVQLSFFFAVRPYNPEGVSTISKINYLSSGAFVINDRLGVVFDQTPDNVICLAASDGDVSEHHLDYEMVLSAECKNKQASAFVEYRLILDPGEEKVFTAKLPMTQQDHLTSLIKSTVNRDHLNSKITQLHNVSLDNFLSRQKNEWAAIQSSIGHLSLSDPKLQQLWNNSVTYVLNTMTPTGINPSGSMHSGFCIYSAIRCIMALTRIGAFDHAQNALAHFPVIGKSTHKIDRSKFDQWGQLLVTLADYQALSNDTLLLDHYFPKVEQIVHRIMKTSKDGQLQASASIDPLGRKDRYFWDLLWNIAGVRSATLIAERLKHREKLDAYFHYDRTLMNMFETWTTTRNGNYDDAPLLPISNTRQKDIGLLKSLAVAAPLRLLPPNDARIHTSIQYILDHFCVNSIFFSPVGKQGYNIEDNFQLASALLYSKHPMFHDVFSWLITQCGPTSSWPESIHPKSHGGCAGDGHYVSANADYILLMRSILLDDQEESLVLCPSVPALWLENDHQFIDIQQMPTHFGKISCRITRINNTLELTLDSRALTRRPKSIILQSPFPVEKLSGKGTLLKGNQVQFSVDTPSSTLYLK